MITSSDLTLAIIVIQVILRIVSLLVCVNKARSLNRSTKNWGIFALLLPVFAIIIIHFMKYKIAWQYSKNRVN